VAQPLVADNAVFFGAGNWLVARELIDGNERFPKIDYRAAIRARPATRGDHLFVPTGDGALHALGLRNGALRWTYRTLGEIVAEPVPVGDTIFLASTDFGVYAIRD
jgi:outer membrane protein assembly factor BamB